ncbi:MAG: hypothetical protein HY301_05055 [Verrucomicrobia bacterium]|nr:hypothetical protein [Verrucomicrobiota bacterium]
MKIFMQEEAPSDYAQTAPARMGFGQGLAVERPGFRFPSDASTFNAERGLREIPNRQRITFVFVQTAVPHLSISLSEFLKADVGINPFITQPLTAFPEAEAKAASYFKNGILVHGGKGVITPEDVAKALAEE